MKTLLITGGSGYVGTRLINKLLKETDMRIINYDISLLETVIYQRIQNLFTIRTILQT